MKSYGIIGFPLTHSFSQRYFTEKIAKEGIADAVFHNFPLPNIEAFQALLLNHPALKGLAVTIPYKEQILPYINHLTHEVKRVGAANCIKMSNGELTAYNTDIIGFERSFTKQLRPQHTKALLLGTGGASKAVQYVLRKLGIEFLVLSRTPGANQVVYEAIDESILSAYKIIINSTPLGMFPSEESCPPLPYHLLTPGHYLYDLVYNPTKTLFLQKGEQYGAVIKNGMEMLIIQAEENWKIWNDL